MKTKLLLICLSTAMISSCGSYHQLPAFQNIDVDRFGSLITIKNNKDKYFSGELISIENNEIYVLQKSSVENEKEWMVFPFSEVKSYRLRYAQPKKYGWAIPLYLATTVLHGYIGIFTFPLNLIVTASVAAGGDNAFTYTNKHMSYDKLKMFARFPQGIPSNIDLKDIR